MRCIYRGPMSKGGLKCVRCEGCHTACVGVDEPALPRGKTHKDFNSSLDVRRKTVEILMDEGLLPRGWNKRYFNKDCALLFSFAISLILM